MICLFNSQSLNKQKLIPDVYKAICNITSLTRWKDIIETREYDGIIGPV